MSNFLVKNQFHTYYFRIRTPTFIINLLPLAKKEVKISLNTKYRTKALILAREHKVIFDAFFLKIRDTYTLKSSIKQNYFNEPGYPGFEEEMLENRAIEAIQDQQYTQQLFFLFERKKRIAKAFKQFDMLKGRSLADIDLSSVSKINRFMAIIDLLSSDSLSDPMPYLNQVLWKVTNTQNPSTSPSQHYPDITMKRLVINRKKQTQAVIETVPALQRNAKKTRKEVKETLLNILDNDINDQPSSVRTQIDEIEENEDVIIEGINLETEQDVSNFAKLISLIQNGNSVSSDDISQCATPIIVPKSMLKMSELFDQFYKVRSKEWASKTTHTSNLAIYRSFTEIIGDIFVDNFNYKHANSYVDILQEMPINRNKSKIFRDLTVAEILVFNDVYDRMSTTTVNKYIGRISEAFDWAVKRGYMNSNIMSVQKIKNTQQKLRQKKNSLRSVFSNEQLATIFSANEFTKSNYNRTYQFWTPLLGLYTGARIQEISQLRLSDVYQKSGIWVFDLNEEEDKKLKNINGIRLIPVHKKLIKLGFIRYVNHLKLCNENGVLNTTLLFPDLLIGKGGYGHNTSKSFIRMLNRIKVKKDKNDGLVFHSFRHTFADGMKQAMLNPTMTAELLGHSLGGETLKTYAKDYAISTLKKEIDKYEPLSDDQLKKIVAFKFWKEITPKNTLQQITEVNKQKSIYDNKALLNALLPRLKL